MKNTILIVCTVVNVVITLVALIFVFKVDVLWTGPLGDTFGGLISPIVGGISVYLIFETFKSQQEQLKDQRKATNATIGLIYLDESRDLLKGVAEKISDLKFIDRGTTNNKGLEAVKSFGAMYQNKDISVAFLSQENVLLESLTLLVEKITFVARLCCMAHHRLVLIGFQGCNSNCRYTSIA